MCGHGLRAPCGLREGQACCPWGLGGFAVTSRPIRATKAVPPMSADSVRVIKGKRPWGTAAVPWGPCAARDP